MKACDQTITFYLLIQIFSFISCYEKHYVGYSVIRVVPETKNQLKFLQNWAQNLTDSQLSAIDFWRYPSYIHTNVNIMVSPNIKTEIIQLFESKSLKPDIMIENLENRIRQEKYYSELIERQIKVDIPENWNNWGNWDVNNWGGWDNNNWVINNQNWNKKISNIGSDFLNNYESIEKIHSFLDQLKQKDPNRIFTQSIGRSTEGRELKMIKIGDSNDKPIAWIDGGTHAREWLGITTALYIAYQLADAQQKCFVQKSGDCPQDMKELLNLYDWHILPVLNPDGYTYSRNNDRMWRKTRSKHTSRANAWGVPCLGVDPNRNYDIAFGGASTSSNPCSDQYHGPYAFSEPETRSQAQHLKSFVSNGVSRIKFFLSFHTYSQLILIPWAYTSQKPLEYYELESVAKEGYVALHAIEGTEYRIGTASTLLYPAAGSASDWAFSKSGAAIKYSYTFELRDRGENGFIMPQSKIIPTGNETLAAVKAMTKRIALSL